MTTLQRWHGTWRALGAGAPSEPAYRELVARYVEPQRHYHTMQHLAECFTHWDAVREEAERPGEVELALWFHDAIYDVERSYNEERSAELARAAIAGAGLPSPEAAQIADRVTALILETRHRAAPSGPDAACVVDADLAILAAPPSRFDEYEAQVRAEYARVPEVLYRRERREVLSRFLARPHLFATRHFRRVAEGDARENLLRSIARLGDPSAGG